MTLLRENEEMFNYSYHVCSHIEKLERTATLKKKKRRAGLE